MSIDLIIKEKDFALRNKQLTISYTRYNRCCILTFDPAKHAIPKSCTGRKVHIPIAVMRRNRVGGLG